MISNFNFQTLSLRSTSKSKSGLNINKIQFDCFMMHNSVFINYNLGIFTDFPLLGVEFLYPFLGNMILFTCVTTYFFGLGLDTFNIF